MNEAAILAAGFAHRKVRNADDCPPCFSRVIAQYAIELNDGMPDALRNELLMPFILRLAGTADSPVIEAKRLEYIALAFMQRIMPRVDECVTAGVFAGQCEGVRTVGEAWFLAKRMSTHCAYDDRCGMTYPTAKAMQSGKTELIGSILEGTFAEANPKLENLTFSACTGRLYRDVCGLAWVSAEKLGTPREREIFTRATDILDQAIKMGNYPASDYVEGRRFNYFNGGGSRASNKAGAFPL